VHIADNPNADFDESQSHRHLRSVAEKSKKACYVMQRWRRRRFNVPFPVHRSTLEAGGARRKTLTLLLILTGKANNALCKAISPLLEHYKKSGVFASNQKVRPSSSKGKIEGCLG